jgi:hypothetical protein
MPTRLWQTLMLTFAIVALGFAVGDALDWQQYTDDHITTDGAPAGPYARVSAVTGTPAENGGIEPGDLIRPSGGRLTLRREVTSPPAGTVEHWDVRRGSRTFTTSIVVAPIGFDDIVFTSVVNALRIAMILVAMLVVVRRPDPPEARALAAFLIAFGFALLSTPAWLPDALLLPVSLIRGPIQILGLGYAAAFACIFPAPSARGVRALLRRVNGPIVALIAVAIGVMSWIEHTQMPPPDLGPFNLIAYTPFYFLFVMAIAFTIGTRQARGVEKQRAYWASGSLLVGFSGPIISTIARTIFNVYPLWAHLAELTLMAIPLGLAYTILRHRTIDLGFVISRALVLTAISFIVVAAFGLLERALGKIFIDMSHVASRSVEIALALGLGFSLRTLHVRVERAVDYLFFRGRQRALGALRAFSRDVYYITDPATVVERTVALIGTHLDAAAVTVITTGIDESDDPLLVRLRASRDLVALRDLATAIHGEFAFPMVVRGTLTGALIVAAKRTGETYDPEERQLLRELAERVGFALDALQTLAIRRELEDLRSATGGAVPAF